jgi:hypothetical protein
VRQSVSYPFGITPFHMSRQDFWAGRNLGRGVDSACGRVHADLRSSTETSGSSQNAQTAAPKMRSPAATMNGACQEPN